MEKSASFFWDNLIPIKQSLAGEQYAGWKPTKENAKKLGCLVLSDQRIPVNGGITLSGDVYTPKVAGRYPVIISYAPYCKEMHTAGVPNSINETGCPPVFTNRGYCHIIVTARAMSRSGGEFGIFWDAEQVDDHEACIEWAAKQPWCNGEVVLFGTSYYGMNQALVAVKNPPALKAFFCNEICTDFFRHVVQFGGVPNIYFQSLWSGANFKQTDFNKRMSPFKRALISHFTNNPYLNPILKKAVKKNIVKLLKDFMSATTILPVRKIMANWLFDGKTRETNCTAFGPYAELDKINVPFVTIQNLGCWNLHNFGSYDLFENAATPGNKKWMILSPPAYDLPVYSYQLEAVAFFDHILLGEDNGYAAQAPVRYWLDGKESFKSAVTFPAAESKSIRFYLNANGNDRAVHQLITNVPLEGKNSWEAIPMGLPIPGGINDVINQTLVYEMTIDKDTEFAGAVSAQLNFSCNDIDSHVVAKFSRIDKNGEVHLLSMGTISPARRRLDPKWNTSCEIVIDTQIPQPLIPDEIVPLSFSLTPAPTFLRAGEKIRFEVASRADLLKSDVEHGHCHFDIAAPPYFSKNTLHYGEGTYLQLDMAAK